MNNSKADCSQSKKKLQINKYLLKIRLLYYNFDCFYHPFLLSIQIQSVIKSLNGKKNIRNSSSQSAMKTPLFFDHFYLVFDLHCIAEIRAYWVETKTSETNNPRHHQPIA